jgi:hypothetical protein
MALRVFCFDCHFLMFLLTRFFDVDAEKHFGADGAEEAERGFGCVVEVGRACIGRLLWTGRVRTGRVGWGEWLRGRRRCG